MFGAGPRIGINKSLSSETYAEFVSPRDGFIRGHVECVTSMKVGPG